MTERCSKCGSFLRSRTNGDTKVWCIICDVLKPDEKKESKSENADADNVS